MEERDLHADEMARQAARDGRTRPISQILREKMRESVATAQPVELTPEQEAMAAELTREAQEMGLYDPPFPFGQPR